MSSDHRARPCPDVSADGAGADAPRSASQADQQRAGPLDLGSLRVQMALGSALVALVAVLLVAGIALLTVAFAFNTYQRAQIAGEASRIATTIGQALGENRSLSVLVPGGANGPGATIGSLEDNPGTTNLWVMDASGQVLIAPRTDTGARDATSVTAALRRALGGQSSEDVLSGRAPPLGLNIRLYAATPIYAGARRNGPIIGAIALSTPLRSGRAAVFVGAVGRFVLLLACGVAALSAAAATIFSRRLTQPLAHLTSATAQMARGAYDTRVDIRSPEELRSLGASFNEMAAALERDVAELRREEQLRRELVANVSHELATPLTAIQGFTEALLDGVVREPDDRAQTTRLIAREAARLRRLVDQLRQVALFEAGAQALDRAAVHLPALVDETLAVLAPEMERKQITVSSEMPAALPAVLADDDRLTEILLNLLDNAFRHTPDHGRIEVSVAVEGSFVRVSVADSGPGIAAEDRERIFERFHRLDPSRSAATGGTGLGLAIVRALVEAHGGAVRADERPGGGARFSFTLPIAG